MIKYRSLLEITKPYKVVAADVAEGKINHCYMLTGDDKVAIDGLITLMSEKILCDKGGCGECVTCMKIEDGNHEDVFEPKNLKAEGIREFVEQVYIKPNGKYKILIIRELDKVDAKVQNFLLKSLEEPVDNVVFLLGAEKQTAVLETIKSRSKKLAVLPFSRYALEDYFAKRTQEYPNRALVKESVDCCLGSLTRCEELIKDEEYASDLTNVIFVLKDMTSTKDNLRMQQRLGVADGKLARYLDMMQLIAGVLLKKAAGIRVDGFEKVNCLKDVFNIPALVNFNSLIIEAKRKLESNCKESYVLDNLFIKLMEVKYLCR